MKYANSSDGNLHFNGKPSGMLERERERLVSGKLKPQNSTDFFFFTCWPMSGLITACEGRELCERARDYTEEETSTSPGKIH